MPLAAADCPYLQTHFAALPDLSCLNSFPQVQPSELSWLLAFLACACLALCPFASLSLYLWLGCLSVAPQNTNAHVLFFLALLTFLWPEWSGQGGSKIPISCDSPSVVGPIFCGVEHSTQVPLLSRIVECYLSFLMRMFKKNKIYIYIYTYPFWLKLNWVTVFLLVVP